MRSLVAAVMVAAGLAAAGYALAARNPVEPVAARGLELIVVEIESCRACGLLRDHVLPAYQGSPNARRAPMRIVHLDSVERSRLKLATPLDTLPTILLVADGAELERIAGYMAPDAMLTAINQMLERAE